MESDMRLAGAVNLLTSFPPLANAVLIARYAWSPWREAELRGWPSQVLELVRETLSKAPEPVLEAVLSRLEESEWFRANYADIVYHDCAKGLVNARAVYNYLRGLADFGVPMYKRVACIPQAFAEALARLAGSALDDLRRADVAFIVRVYPASDEEEPEQGEMEEYACSPSWALAALGRVAELLAESTPKGAGLASEVDRLAAALEDARRRGGSRGYAYARTAALAGPKALTRARNALEAYEGSVVGVGGVLDLAAGLPAFNYSIEPLVVMAVQAVETPVLAYHAARLGYKVDELEWDANIGGLIVGDSILAVPEAALAAGLKGFTGRIIIPDSRGAEASLTALRALGAILKVRKENGLLAIEVRGYRR